MRPDGTRNIVITDHLGSTRLTLSTDAAPMQSQLHNAFGEVTSDVGEGARTGYIGREHDVESDLGFYGVRLYEPEYGRFMSTDPLWGEFITLQPYHYCRNQPIFRTDRGGMGDFFDEEGNFVKSDGVNDGMKFMAEKSVYESADPNLLLRNVEGVFELPNKRNMEDIEANIVKPATSMVGYNREHGGIVTTSDDYIPTEPGPRVDAGNSNATVDFDTAILKMKDEQYIKLMVHSHPNLDQHGKKSSLQYDSDLSPKDKAIAARNGAIMIVIFPFQNSQGAFVRLYNPFAPSRTLVTTTEAIKKANAHETK